MVPYSIPLFTLFLFLSLMPLMLAPTPNMETIIPIRHCRGYVKVKTFVKSLLIINPIKSHVIIGVNDVINMSNPILNNLFINTPLNTIK